MNRARRMRKQTTLREVPIGLKALTQTTISMFTPIIQGLKRRKSGRGSSTTHSSSVSSTTPSTRRSIQISFSSSNSTPVANPLFPNLREVVWEHAVPELLSVISPTIRVLKFPFNDQVEENYALPKEVAYRMRRHTFKTLLPGMLQSLPELRELYLRRLGHPGFWCSFTPEPNHRFVAQHIHTLHITESLAVLLWGALPAVSTIQQLEELKIDC
ncbi:hypothetical protein DAEQUDRAFT_559915 [Daedalea quercina L-15889]|uniref:Uncharacterized protein n=1 Tax=Daedalea quercina L-15889 TaxID=1314783 RepID=A0A165M0Q0_9APHY|nr:hypothetical protein DAEQUDRAFT_559915 [Daedalea quercina L-15889]